MTMREMLKYSHPVLFTLCLAVNGRFGRHECRTNNIDHYGVSFWVDGRIRYPQRCSSFPLGVKNISVAINLCTCSES